MCFIPSCFFVVQISSFAEPMISRRGYGMDPDKIYHTPDLPPPHNYYALYQWLREEWKADAIVHMGKHGTLEWLPGKGVGLSNECFPDTFLADLPLIYPVSRNSFSFGYRRKVLVLLTFSLLCHGDFTNGAPSIVFSFLVYHQRSRGGNAVETSFSCSHRGSFVPTHHHRRWVRGVGSTYAAGG